MRAQPSSIVFLLAVTTMMTAGVVMQTLLAAESLWLDELHSRWVIAGSLSDVASRAAQGNQSPGYFWCLWLWCVAFGSSSISLRAPSMLAWALAVIVLARHLRDTRGQRFALIAVLFAVCDRNAMFFATEARPYAAVMLAAAVLLCQQPFSTATSSWKPVSATFLTALSLGCLHLTGIPFVVGWAGFMLAGSWITTGNRNAAFNVVTQWRMAWIAMLAACIAGLMQWSVLRQTWTHRTEWQLFGAVESWITVWRIWPWMVYLLIPLTLLLLAEAFHRLAQRFLRGPRTRTPFRWTHLIRSPLVWLALLVIGYTLAMALVSFLRVAPLFHRRYLVGLLPALWWLGAESWCLLGRRWLVRHWTKAAPQIWEAVYLMPIGLLLLFSQGTLTGKPRLHFSLPYRGEPWQALTDQLILRATSMDRILLAAELVESPRLLTGNLSADELEYHRFALMQPGVGKSLRERIRPLPPLRSVSAERLAQAVDGSAHVWLVARHRAAVLEPWLTRRLENPVLQGWRPETIDRFGPLTLIRLTRQ